MTEMTEPRALEQRARLRGLMVSMLACVALLASTPARSATTVTLRAVDSGWYRADGSVNPNPNPSDSQTCVTGLLGVVEHRSFVSFEVPALAGRIATATLRLYNAASSSAQGVETVAVFEVKDALRAGGAAGRATFADLGDGRRYGSVDALTDPADSRLVEIPLDAAALGRAGGLPGPLCSGWR